MSTDKQTIDWYNENAEKYTTHVRDSSDSIYHSYYEKPAMYSLLPPLAGKTVLSLGCGSGEDSNYLKQNGAQRSLGIDVSQKLIQIAQRDYPECEFSVMDMEQLDFPDNSIDFVYSSLAIHYIENWTQVLKECFRVLKPGSYFLFSCCHPIWSAMAVSEQGEQKKVKQLAFVKDRETNEVEVIGDYLTHRNLTNNTGDIDVKTWHKPISEIMSEVKESGFQIDALVEPAPSEELKNINVSEYSRLAKVPYVMILKLRK